MQVFFDAGVVLLSYLLGSLPFGLLIVKALTGRDIRQIESGRTGGTNAMRAAGLGAGLLTAVMDILKAAASVWLAKAVSPGAWIHVLAPLAVILGHNYSIFLMERGKGGRLRLRGGAGGAACVGGSVGLWAPSLLIIIPIGALIFFGVGYASLTTMSVALISAIIFAVRAWLGLSPWQYLAYGLLAEVLVVWALRPNIKRLLDGTERLHGWRAKKKPTKAASAPRRAEVNKTP